MGKAPCPHNKRNCYPPYPANNVGSCFIHVGSCVQTFSSPEPLDLICNDPDHVAKKRRALGTRIVCKWLPQLPSMLGLAVHRGKDTTHTTLQTMCNACAWLQQCWKNCGKRIQHCCAMLRRSRNERNVGRC